MTAKNQYEVTANFEGERKLVGLAERGEQEGQHVIHLFDEFDSANLIDVEVSDEAVDDPKKVVADNSPEPAVKVTPAAPVAEKDAKK